MTLAALDARPRTRADIRRGQKRARERFLRSRKAEAEFRRRLLEVARQVGVLIDTFAPGGVVEDLGPITAALTRYSELLLPWARATANRMLSDVDRRDRSAWMGLSHELGVSLRDEINSAPMRTWRRELLAEQVELITSLPTKAAERVHRLTTEALSGGRRAEDIARDIARSGQVTASRARLIARTEVARSATSLTMIRSQEIGSPGYIWRTAHDKDVRQSHREMEAVYVPWDQPPTLSDGYTTHAGMIFNCRCFPEPVIPGVQ